MILEIKFNNFRQFKGNYSLSFLADGRTKKLMSNSINIDNRDVLKTVVLYGSNNSGKTTIVKLVEQIKHVLLGDADIDFNRPFFHDSPVSDVSITFNNKDGLGWLKYEFSYDSSKSAFVKERLSRFTFYKAGNPYEVEILVKDSETKKLLLENIDYSDRFDFISLRFPILHSINTDGEGVFASLNKWKKALFDCGNSIEIVSLYNIPMKKTESALKGENQNEKDFISSFVKNADVCITSFDYMEEPLIRVHNKEIDEKSLQETKDLEDSFHLATTYQGVQIPSLLFDSTGTKKIESIASYVYESLSLGKTLVIDELDSGLHYRLSRAIVSLFNNVENVKGQMLFTAHDLMLVEAKMLLRKDQIYFVFRKEVEANLISLKEFPVSEGGPRGGSDLVKQYNAGRIGYVPSPSFIRSLLTLIDAEGETREQ